MSNICTVVQPNEAARLNDFMKRRREELLGLCSSPSEPWKKDALETLMREFFLLEEPVRAAAVGATFEYAVVLALIAEYFATLQGEPTRQLLDERQEVLHCIRADLKVYEAKKEKLNYTAEELSLLGQLEEEIVRLYGKLQRGRPA